MTRRIQNTEPAYIYIYIALFIKFEDAEQVPLNLKTL